MKKFFSFVLIATLLIIGVPCLSVYADDHPTYTRNLHLGYNLVIDVKAFVDSRGDLSSSQKYEVYSWFLNFFNGLGGDVASNGIVKLPFDYTIYDLLFSYYPYADYRGLNYSAFFTSPARTVSFHNNVTASNGSPMLQQTNVTWITDLLASGYVSVDLDSALRVYVSVNAYRSVSDGNYYVDFEFSLPRWTATVYASQTNVSNGYLSYLTYGTMSVSFNPGASTEPGIVPGQPSIDYDSEIVQPTYDLSDAIAVFNYTLYQNAYYFVGRYIMLNGSCVFSSERNTDPVGLGARYSPLYAWTVGTSFNLKGVCDTILRYADENRYGSQQGYTSSPSLNLGGSEIRRVNTIDYDFMGNLLITVDGVIYKVNSWHYVLNTIYFSDPDFTSPILQPLSVVNMGNNVLYDCLGIFIDAEPYEPSVSDIDVTITHKNHGDVDSMIKDITARYPFGDVSMSMGVNYTPVTLLKSFTSDNFDSWVDINVFPFNRSVNRVVDSSGNEYLRFEGYNNIFGEVRLFSIRNLSYECVNCTLDTSNGYLALTSISPNASISFTFDLVEELNLDNLDIENEPIFNPSAPTQFEDYFNNTTNSFIKTITSLFKFVFGSVIASTTAYSCLIVICVISVLRNIRDK